MEDDNEASKERVLLQLVIGGGRPTHEEDGSGGAN